jgi:hypothetical protein
MSIHEDTDLPAQVSQLFTLRFWSEDLGNGQFDWRGKVQHINKGEVIYFREWLVLEAFIEKFLQSADQEPGTTLHGLKRTPPEEIEVED